MCLFLGNQPVPSSPALPALRCWGGKSNRRGRGLHPASRRLAPAGERGGGGHERWSPARDKAALSLVVSSFCRAFWSGIARFPTRH